MKTAILSHGVLPRHRDQILNVIQAYGLIKLYVIGTVPLPFEVPCEVYAFNVVYEEGALGVLNIERLVIPPQPERSRNSPWLREGKQRGLALVMLIDPA